MGLKYYFFSKILHAFQFIYERIGFTVWQYYLKTLRLIDYDMSKQMWGSAAVHSDMSNPENYYRKINETMKFEGKDTVLDIGCGDGIIDSYIKVKKLYGFDFSDVKVKEAQENNPLNDYFEHSFLEPTDCLLGKEINKVFSFGVLQYCKPEDIEITCINAINFFDFTQHEDGIIAHLDVPDIDKAQILYYRMFGITERDFNANKEKVKICFSDGSYWHDMKKIKQICIDYLDAGEGYKYDVYLSDSDCCYRTNLVIKIWAI